MGWVRAHAKDLKLYGCLLAGVAAMFVAVFGYQLAAGKTLLWKGDAVSQYYNFFVYEGQWLRQIMADLVAGNGLVVPAFTYDLGYGSDVQTALGGMITDPLNLVSALCPPQHAEALFCMLIFVRYALAAFSFCLFCRSRKAPRPAALAASLAYVGTGYVLFWAALRHPNFLNVAIMLPLLFMFADRIFARKSPVPFMVSLALMFAFSVYFSYWTCFLFLGYCLVRYFFGPRDRSVKDFACLVGRFVAYVAVALALSAVVSFPMISALLSMGRVGEEAFVPLLYSFGYYACIPLNLAGGTADIMGQCVGPVALVAAVLLVAARAHVPKTTYLPTVVGMAACLLLMLVPAFGSFMNGFGYPTDRWLVALGFCFSYALCLVLPVLPRLTREQWVRAGVAVGVIFALQVAGAVVEGSVVSLVPCLFALGCFVVFAVTARRVALAIRSLLASGMCLAGTLCVCLLNYASCGGGYGDQFNPGLSIWSQVQSSPAAAVAAVGDQGEYRFDYAGCADKKNRSLVVGQRGVDFFTSYYNQAVDDYRQEMEFTDSSNHHAYIGSDGRLASELLIGAKYVVSAAGSDQLVPDGYQLHSTAGDRAVYQASVPTPLAFTYGSYLDRATYEALPVQQKQEALLQACVLGASSLSKPSGDQVSVGAVGQAQAADLDFSSQASSGLAMVAGEGVELQDGRIVVTKRNGTLILQVPDALDQSEVYVCLSGFDYEGTRPLGKAKKGSSLIHRMKVKLDALTWTSPGTCEVKAAAGDHKAEFTYKTKTNTTYGNKHEWTMNLGYFEKAPKTITLTLPFRGTYYLSDLQVVCQPTQPLLDQAQVLGRNAIDNVEYGVNSVTATVGVGEQAGSEPNEQAERGSGQSGEQAAASGADKTTERVEQSGGQSAAQPAELAFFSLPYSSGWSATVDGQDVPVLRANTGFMAVEVAGAGEHQVVLTYVTPGRSVGAVVSAAGLAALIALALRHRRSSSGAVRDASRRRQGHACQGRQVHAVG